MKNIKWLITEIVNIYSNKDSFFSKKRIESGIAFVIAQWGMITYFIHKYSNMQMSDIALWASIEFAVAGYMISYIQKEKKEQSNDTPPNNSTDPPIN